MARPDKVADPLGLLLPGTDSPVFASPAPRGCDRGIPRTPGCDRGVAVCENAGSPPGLGCVSLALQHCRGGPATGGEAPSGGVAPPRMGVGGLPGGRPYRP